MMGRVQRAMTRDIGSSHVGIMMGSRRRFSVRFEFGRWRPDSDNSIAVGRRRQKRMMMMMMARARRFDSREIEAIARGGSINQYRRLEMDSTRRFKSLRRMHWTSHSSHAAIRGMKVIGWMGMEDLKIWGGARVMMF